MGREREVAALSDDGDPYRPPERRGAGDSAPLRLPFAVSYVLTEREFAAGLGRLQRPARVAALAVAAVFLALSAYRALGRTRDPFAPLIGGAVGLVVVLPAIGVGRRRAVHRVYQDLDVGDGVELTIDEDGLRFVAPLSSARVPWDRITRVTTTRDLLLVHRTRMMAHIVPRRVFADDGQWRAVVDLVRDRSRR